MPNQKEKVAVFIDGGNFYFKLKSLKTKRLKATGFDYRAFAKWLAGQRPIAIRNYYIGVVQAEAGDEKAERLRDKQQELFDHLTSKQQKFNVIHGYLMNTQGTHEEKGVDVRIAVDLLVGAYEHQYDTAILVSSDTDLLPALKQIKKLGRRVEHVGFAHQPSYALQKQADHSRSLTKADIEQFTS